MKYPVKYELVLKSFHESDDSSQAFEMYLHSYKKELDQYGPNHFLDKDVCQMKQDFLKAFNGMAYLFDDLNKNNFLRWND